MKNLDNNTNELKDGNVEEIIKDLMIVAFKNIYDPEIPVDIYNLGLIYGIEHTPQEDAADSYTVHMTLTSPGCPVAGALVEQVEYAALNVQGVEAVKVNLTFEPPWNMEYLSQEGRIMLEMDGAHIASEY